MAKVKLRAVLTVTVDYECEEDYDGCESVSQLCRHEESAIRNDPTDFCDVPSAKIEIKVERIKS
jgi:hypothetical protein